MFGVAVLEVIVCFTKLIWLTALLWFLTSSVALHQHIDFLLKPHALLSWPIVIDI